MKKLIVALAFGATALLPGMSSAANSTSNFDVTITLNSACTIGAITAVDFQYTSFGALVNGTGGGFNLTCTNNLSYTFGLVAGAGGAAPGAASITVTDADVNLQYTLFTPAPVVAGTGAAQAYTITGTMAASQSGNCASATCTNTASANKTQTLVVNF